MRRANKTGVRANLCPDTDSTGAAGDEASSGPRTEPKAVPIAAAPVVAPRAAPPVASAPAAAPPVASAPAAETVINGEVTEETLKLRQDLETERAARKKVEQDNASVTDEFQRYKDATEARTRIPIKPAKYSFLRRRA